MQYVTVLMTFGVVCLFILNVYQFLTQKAALRIAEILYIMSRHVREKASEVRREGKDVEIVEAHLFDISTSARTLLKTLGRSETALGPDPALDLPPSSNKLDSESLLRLADNILYSVVEDSPKAEWEDVVNRTLERFLVKAPTLDREAAKRIIDVVAQRSEKPNGSLIFSFKE